MLAVPRGQWAGLFIEMKRPGEYPNAEQRERIAELRAQGYRVEVCKSVEEFIQLVSSYLAFPLNSSLMLVSGS